MIKIKQISLFTALALVSASPLFCTAGASNLTPGSYEGSANGRNGEISVKVDVSDSKILGVRIQKHHETPGLSDTPLKVIPERIVKNQSIAVDKVTGATFTSNGIIAATKNALEKSSKDISQYTKKVSEKISKPADTTADIVVVGAGSAGLPAVIAAAEAGKKVILIDKTGMMGGGDSLNISTSLGGIGTKLAKDLNVQANAEDFYKKLMEEARTKKIPVNEDMIRTYALKSPEIHDWLYDHGVPFGRFSATDFKSMIKDGSAPGPHLIKALGNAVNDLGVDVRLNQKVVGLLIQNGKIAGVEVETPAGKYKIHSKAVVIATGGYSNSHELISKFAPEWLGRPTTGSPAAKGEGILMAQKVGADVADMEQVKINYLCHPLTKELGISLTTITPYTILINHDGNRFVSESNPSINAKSRAMMKQPKHEAYAIVDQNAMDKLKLARSYANVGYFVKGDTPELLCKQLDTNFENCVKSINNYIEASKVGKDEAFGRKIIHPFNKPPFYASLVTPALQSSYGGIKTNVKAEVVDTKGQPIPGLYAAGATSGHQSFANEVGNATIIGMSFGRIAGENAAQYVSR